MIKYLIIVLLLTLSLNAKIRSGSSSESGSIGVNLIYFTPDFDSLNRGIKSLGIGGFEDGMFLWGGEISGAVNSMVSIGAQYYNGATSISGRVDKIYEGNNVKVSRNVRYNIGYGGLNVTYNRKIGFGNYFLGGSANYGSIKLQISQDGGDLDFSQLINSYNDPNLIHSTNLKMDLYAFEIYSGVKIPIAEKVSIMFSAGYLYGFCNENGVLNYDFENVSNVPDMDIKSFRYSISLMFGA
ncbi:MAG: hypothetical protein CR982_06335 [Candidatus Cloacimonadota bacterium]|nr:MAG: hypothetical protein CR982_06335 [Candidatus Cloacimonadota bacterium]PIE79075.1 MAG: hypothetical protein CSA15_04625 [Candidatus Delongbacteria bacterium]